MQERRVDNALSHSASHDVAAVAVEAAARMLGLAWACARVQFAQVARRRCLLLACVCVCVCLRRHTSKPDSQWTAETASSSSFSLQRHSTHLTHLAP
uniref:Secreted protein n=1 Tax=Mesocestoides corti TaxID=53468 RepID=A0A5K3EF48_MESCO